MRNFAVRTVTGILYVAIIVAGFLKAEAMIALFALVTGMTIWEFTGLVNDEVERVAVNRFISTVAGVYFFFAVAGYVSGFVPSSGVFIPYLLTVVYLFISELYLKQENPVNDWAYTMLSQMYIALPLSCISVLAFFSYGSDSVIFCPLLPLSVFVFLWMNDTGAYCVGSLLGRHKLFPRVSPGKTWEGSLGGGVLVLLVAALIWYLTRDADPDTFYYVGALPSLLHWLGLGAVIAVFGTWGDLVESLFKRTLGIKDSGNILPGHGGMLDRFDSALMAFPAAVIYVFSLSLL